MKIHRLILVPVLLAAVALPASAGIFFNKRPKQNPTERVPALLIAVKTETNDRKREAAAEELRQYDPKAFPEIVPVLIDVMQHDNKAGVRLEAAQSVAKFRPVSQEVGFALEEMAAHDEAVRVRLQARSLLVQYRLSGYRSGKKVEDVKAPSAPSNGIKTDEPPLADPGATKSSPPSAPSQPRKTLVPRLLPMPTSTPSAPPDVGPELAPPK
jgi:hypothetical protein